MNGRSKELQAFLDTAEAAILERTGPDDLARQSAERIFGALRRRPGQAVARIPANLPVLANLHDVAQSLAAEPSAANAGAAKHAMALAALVSKLNWSKRKGSEALGEPFVSGHANTTIVGEGGIEQRDDVWIGATVLAPGIRYPFHHHPPEEVYVVMSPGDWYQEGRGWFEPGTGGIVFNRPDIEHSMRSTGSAPLLATWWLWRGDSGNARTGGLGR